MNDLADLIVNKIIDRQRVYDEQFKAYIEELANNNPDLEIGTTSQEEIILTKLDELKAELKHCEEIQDYIAASKILIKIEKYKAKYNL